MPELRAGWRVLLAAVIGVGLGVVSIPAPALALVQVVLHTQMGWSSAQIALGPTIMLYVLAGVSPAVGWLVDRCRAVWVCTSGLVGLAVCMYAFSRLGPHLFEYYSVCAAIGLFAAGSSAVPFSRTVSAAFVHNRGVALGAAVMGSGLAGIFLPLWLVPFAARVGWRHSFVVLSAIIAVGALVVAALLAGAPAPAARNLPTARDALAEPSPRWTEIARDRTFWTLAIAFALIGLAAGGLHFHLFAYLADEHLSPHSAAHIASAGGAAIVVCRLFIGWLFDRVAPNRVCAATLVVGAGCVVALAEVGVGGAWLGALAIGLVVGSEIDFIGYLTARYFGMQSYGQVYGAFYLLNLVGSGSSAVLYGLVRDKTGSYHDAFFAAAAAWTLVAILFLTLRASVPAARSHPAQDLSVVG